MRERPILDLTRHHFRRTLGDITLFGAWFGESDDRDACLVLVPTHRQSKDRGAKPCIVARNDAHKYYDELSGPETLLAMAQLFNRYLGFEDSMTNVHRVAKVIGDHLQDLLEIPPEPEDNAYVAADAIVTDSSGRQRSAEIIDYKH